MDIVQNINKLMKNNGIKSFAEFERTCGLSQGTIRKWDIGEYKPSLKALNKISKSFNVSTDFLLGSNEETIKKEQTQIKELARDLEKILIETEIISPADDLSEKDYKTILKFLESNFTANAEFIKNAMDKK